MYESKYFEEEADLLPLFENVDLDEGMVEYLLPVFKLCIANFGQIFCFLVNIAFRRAVPKYGTGKKKLSSLDPSQHR